MNLLDFFIFAAMLMASLALEKQDLVVNTQHGPVRGTVKYASGSDRPVYSYFGISYARAPDYTFRFRPPVDPWAWSEVKNVTNEQVPICYQDRKYLKMLLNNAVFQYYIDGDHPMSEDCLNLNIFTPYLSSSKDKLLPVVVWIHGGSLQATASTQDLWMMPAFEDVVLVAVQYRLGAFGFMSFDNRWAPPNAGLFDQLKALKWIQKNIQNFGGNPSSVTLYGVSAGGISATALAVSEMSRGLFHRVVAGSGVFTMPLTWGSDHEKKASRVAEKLDCQLGKVCFTATCIRNRRSSSAIINATRSENAIFYLQVDGKLFPASPNDLVSNLNPSVPLLLGVTAGEMDYLILRKIIPSDLIGPKLTRATAENLFRKILETYYPNLQKYVDEFIALYLKNNTNWETLLAGLSEFSADAFFNFPAVELAGSAIGNGVNVYFYQFSKRPSYYDKAKTISRPFKVTRPDHSEDQGFFLGYPFQRAVVQRGMTFTQEESILSQKMMKILSSFAETDHPVFDQSQKWPKYPSFVDINVQSSIKHNFRAKYLNVWKKLLNFENKKSTL